MLVIPVLPSTPNIPTCFFYTPPTPGDKLYIFAACLEKHFTLRSFEATLNNLLQVAWKGRALSLLIY